MIKEKYYFLTWDTRQTKNIGVAYAPENTPLAYELIDELGDLKELPFVLSLKKVKETNKGLKINEISTDKEQLLDYQPNSLAWPIMSEKLKSSIENNLTGKENIDWISCNIKVFEEYKKYFILRFNKKLDVLDNKKTMFVPGTDQIIKPCFSLSKIKSYSIFPSPISGSLWRITSGLYINEQLKKNIKKEKITGIDFENVQVA